MNEQDLDSLVSEVEAAPEPEIEAKETVVETPAPVTTATTEAPPAAKPEPKTIPLAAYLEDKSKWASKFETLENELKALKNPPKPPAVKPEFIDDPKAYVDHDAQQTKAAIEELKSQISQTGKTAEEIAAETRFNHFVSSLQASETAFKATKPDYNDALAHLRNARAAEITLAYPNVTQEQLIQGIRQEELALAHQLMQSGRNPHEVAYQLAEARGYKPAAPAVELPKVPAAKQLPPDLNLGSGVGEEGRTDDQEQDEFGSAWNDLFGKRKRA